MKTAIIKLEADRIVWDMPALQPDGSLIQHVRLYEGKECRVELVANFHKDSTEAIEFAICHKRMENARLETEKLQRQRIRAGITCEVSKA